MTTTTNPTISSTTGKTAGALDTLAAGVASILDGDQWAAALRVAARLHNYSPNNRLLIMMQLPDATRVAGFGTWKSLGRAVRKGERGIAILAPCVIRPKNVANNDAGADSTAAGKSDDTTPTSTADVEESRRLRFRVAYVFDVSQTDGTDLPDPPGSELLGGDGPTGLWDVLAAQVARHGYTLRRGPTDAGSLGYTSSRSREVVVLDSLGGADAAHVLAHELGHIECGHLTDRRAAVSRPRRELEAESVSWLVCQAAGLPTGTSSFGYVAGWADGGRGDPDVALAAVRDTFAVVCEAADRIITRLRPHPDAAEGSA